MAVPLVKTINAPKISRERMIGSSQNFFRSFMNPQRSFKKSTTKSFNMVCQYHFG